MPLRWPIAAALTTLLLSPVPTRAQANEMPLSQQIRIELEHDSERERATAEQLRAVLDRYDVARWIWTDAVRIDQTQIPHSHPVLTLHTRALGAETDQLSTFVHEQFHWWTVQEDDATGAAIAEFRQLFPDPPVGGREGARDQRSSWLHLLVCDLEYQAMELLIGREEARALLSAAGHYTWIYETVLNDPRIREIALRHGFDAATVDAGGLRR